MSGELNPVLALLDDLLAIVEGTRASEVDVSGDGFSIQLRRSAAPAERPASRAGARPAQPTAESVLQIRSPAVGIFSSVRDWNAGDRVEQGTVLGDVQSLGHVEEITAPLSGAIREVLTPSGAPVEYGQPLLAIERS